MSTSMMDGNSEKRSGLMASTERDESELQRREVEKNEDQYPHGLRLTAIMLANMLALLLVALVS